MIKDRIRELRKSCGLSQTAFGGVLGVSRDVINNLEQGRVEPSDLVINMMCAKFDVGMDWLKTGEGEMFRTLTREEEILDWATAICGEDNSFKRRFVYALSKLDENGWQVIERFAQALYDEQLAEDAEKQKNEGE